MEKKAPDILGPIVYTFAECLYGNLIDWKKYNPTYAKICLGICENNGIKSWWDLCCLTYIQISDLPHINSKVKEVLTWMKERMVWHAECFATYCAFMETRNTRYHTMLRKHYFNGNMFTWNQFLKIPYESIETTKYLGPKTANLRSKLKEYPYFHQVYKEYLDHYYMTLKEFGK